MGGLARGAAAHQIAEFEYDRVSDAVKHVVAGTLSAHKAGVKQDLKMLRDVGLVSLQGVDNLVDRHGPLFQRLQNAQPARFSQYLESPGHKFDHFAVDHWSAHLDASRRHLLHYIIIQEY